MTIQEAIERASSGDVEAMVALGDYYAQEKSWTESLKWYEMGAERGSLYCIIQSMTLSSLSVDSARRFSDKDWMIESSEKCGKYANILLREISSHPEQFKPEAIEQFRNDALTQLENARFHLALGIYFSDKNESAISRAVNELRFVDAADNPLARVLLGIFLFEQRNFDESYQKLSILIGNSKSFLSNEPDRFEYGILGVGYHTLSLLCIQYNDVDKAYRVLEDGASALSGSAAMHELLQSELAKYRKKLFGGYEYIG